MLSTPAHLLGTPSCLICSVPLSHLQRARNDRFCGDRCRGKYATLPPHQVCVACGRPLSPRQFGDRLCGSLECRRQVEQQMRERERLLLEVLQNRAEGLRDRVGQGLGLQKPETYTPTVLPASRARITELPECRRHAFREFVNRLLGVAGAPTAASPSGEAAPPPAPASPAGPAPEVQAVLNGACALCRGFCCGNGGNHAYLNVETIRLYMAKHPDQRPHDVLAAYLGRIRNDTVAGSCIFHQPGGCGLPREMRSDTCNRFFCKGLTEFQNGLTGRDPARGFFVATEGEAILAAAFCDAGGSRLVPLPSPADQDGAVAIRSRESFLGSSSGLRIAKVPPTV
jgi:predicted nucleic acid-binding Zn ribbon protein